MLLRSIIAAFAWIAPPAIATPLAAASLAVAAITAPTAPPVLPLPQTGATGTPFAVTALQLASTAPPPAEPETAWSLEDRREIQQALITLGHLQGEPDGNFGSQTPSAIRQFQSFQGESETGTLSQDQRYKLLNMARRLLKLLQPASASPKGATATSLRGGPQRLLKAAGLDSAGDYGEAAYWYRLAANDGEVKAFTNLGTLVVRGQGVDKPDPSAAQLLWLSAAARGEPVAMFDLGTMYEHGIGVAVDLAAAKKWYAWAAAKGHTQARDALKRLDG